MSPEGVCVGVGGGIEANKTGHRITSFLVWHYDLTPSCYYRLDAGTIFLPKHWIS